MNPICNGKPIGYRSPIECCQDAQFVLCQKPPCKIGEPKVDEVGNKTRQVIPMEYFDPLEDGFYRKVESPAECDELCEEEFNNGSAHCNGFVFYAKKFNCQLGRKCNVCHHQNVVGKTTFQGGDFGDLYAGEGK